MAYCTEQDMIDRYGEPVLIQRTDRHRTGVIDSAVLNQAIEDATAEINGYLTRYQLPLAEVPPNFVRMAAEMALYYLYAGVMLDEVAARYDKAVKYLELVAKGSIELMPDDGSPVIATAFTNVQFSTGRTVFGDG